MYIIERDSYTCPHCGCVFARTELASPPEFKDSIKERDNIQCPNCNNFGMNYMTNGRVGHGMVGYTLADVKAAKQKNIGDWR